MELSRRDFLKFGGSACLVAGAGTAVVGCSSTSNSAEVDSTPESSGAEYVVGTSAVNFTKETDILIIGTGISALAAGMAPSLAGKQIIYVEKQGAWGGDSKVSCFFMFGNGTQPQIDAGYPTTTEEAWEASKENLVAGYDQYDWYPEWVKGKTFANTKFVDSAINDFGAIFQKPATEAELPRLFSRVILPGNGIGTGYADILTPIQEKLESSGAEFIYKERAVALIKNTEGAVIGCRFQSMETGDFTDIKANSTVIATGGFAANGEMVESYIPSFSPYTNMLNNCMGEGHLIGAAAGAQLMGMDTTPTYCNLMGDIPNATTWGYWTPIVLVLPNGKRYIEEAQSHDAALAAVEAGYREWWSIFDQRAFDARCINKSVEANINAHAEAYCSADTLNDLAAAMDVPVDALKETFARYDELVTLGEDTDFGKKAWLESLTPPYHALKLNVCRYKTSGGFIVGPNNLVLDTNDEEIPGLYACGAVTTFSFASVSTCAATGYYTGETLAAL